MAAPHHLRNAEPLSEEQTASVRQVLQHILASPAFAGTRRCQQFLAYVVEHGVRGEADLLRERMLGTELFGKPAGYDTATDAIVRVKANEVRKRLGQYYRDNGVGDPVRIELPPGTYTPVFQWASLPLLPPPVAPKRRDWWRVGLFGMAALVAIAALFLLFRPRPEIEEFWAPMLHTNRPILVCLGQSEYFSISSSLRRQLEQNSGPFQINPTDITRLRDSAVSTGMLRATLSVYGLLDQHSKTGQVAWGSEVRFTELRDQNVVLIGAFNNPWTLDIARSARFAFERDDLADGRRRWKIQDQVDRSRSWSPSDMFPRQVDVDYAIITRIFDRARGRVIVAAAGVNQYGTEVAGDFLKDPVSWRETVRSAPKDWTKKNLQLVLQTNLAGEKPVRTQVVASYYW